MMQKKAMISLNEDSQKVYTLLHDEYVREAKNVGKIPYAYRTFTEHYHKLCAEI